MMLRVAVIGSPKREKHSQSRNRMLPAVYHFSSGYSRCVMAMEHA
jgi:hypothetical protein